MGTVPFHFPAYQRTATENPLTQSREQDFLPDNEQQSEETQPSIRNLPNPVSVPPATPDLARVLNDGILASVEDTPVIITATLPKAATIPAVVASAPPTNARIVNQQAPIEKGKHYRVVLKGRAGLDRLLTYRGKKYNLLGLRVEITDAGEWGNDNSFVSIRIGR